MNVFVRVTENLLGRLHGPMTFRLILQPLTALIIGIQDGLHDANAGMPSFFWALLTDPTRRPELLGDTWKAIARVFVLAVIIDTVYQVIEFSWFYAGEALIVASVLAVVPYTLIRGPVNRLVSGVRRLSQKA